MHAFITPFQSAYLKIHSTVSCLHRSIDDNVTCEGIDGGLLCGICFLDIEQGKSEGFDSCDRPSNLTETGFKSSIFQPV